MGQVAERYAVLRAQIVPFVVNALQLVGVAYHVVVLIVECCKLYGKVALPGGHLDHVVCHRVYRLLRAVKKDALEHYRRHEVFLSYLFGLETDVSVGSGKGYLSCPRVEGWLGFRQFGTLAQVAWAEEP